MARKQQRPPVEKLLFGLTVEGNRAVDNPAQQPLNQAEHSDDAPEAQGDIADGQARGDEEASMLSDEGGGEPPGAAGAAGVGVPPPPPLRQDGPRPPGLTDPDYEVSGWSKCFVCGQKVQKEALKFFLPDSEGQKDVLLPLGSHGVRYLPASGHTRCGPCHVRTLFR